MTSELEYGRQPITIVELVQPRCALRFGVSPCTAIGTPKCYQTWLTCRDRENIDLSGSIVWRFAKPEAGILPLYEEDGEDIKANPLPMLVAVTSSSSEINVGAQREGVSPLGVRATVTVTLQDAPFDDHVGDFYLADRAGVRGNFWAKWRARNAFYTNMMIRVYEGYRGQAIGDMQRRDYILEEVDGPNAGGRVTLKGIDPLRLTSEKEAQFPRPTAILLDKAIDAETRAIRVQSVAADLTDTFGTGTGSRRFLRIGSEIVQYTGSELVETGIYDLLDVRRGMLGTPAATATAGQTCQRVGRYERTAMWRIAADLIDNHTTIPAGYRDAAQWTLEGSTYLASQASTGTVTDPTPIDRLLGELCQQGNFVLWWDDRTQKIPLAVNRPPSEDPAVITDTSNILAGSAQLDEDPRAQLTRVVLYYGRRNQASGLTDPQNYRSARVFIDGFIEDTRVAGKVRTLEIFSRWILTDADALQTCARILLRYRFIPKYLAIDVDAKDRTLAVGSICDITTRAIVDSEGSPLAARWQVIRAEEVESGHRISLKLQSYTFIGRFANWMANDANEYASATDDEKENGGFWADNSTLAMPDGDEPYLYQ